MLAGSNDLIATHFHLSLNDITWAFRVLIFVGPWFAFWVTKRICLGLQRKDRELVLHGHETGRIVRFAHGEYIEVHKPLDAHERWLRVQHDAHPPAGDRAGGGLARCAPQGLPAGPDAPAPVADLLRGPRRARDARRAGGVALAR